MELRFIMSSANTLLFQSILTLAIGEKSRCIKYACINTVDTRLVKAGSDSHLLSGCLAAWSLHQWLGCRRRRMGVLVQHHLPKAAFHYVPMLPLRPSENAHPRR